MGIDNDSGKGSSGAGGSPIQPRTWLVWVAVLALIPLLLFFQRTSQQRFQSISQKRLFDLVSSNLVESGEINYSAQSRDLRTVRGRYLQIEEGKTNLVPFTVDARLNPSQVGKLASASATDAMSSRIRV